MEEYDFSHRQRGMAYIINNVDFKQFVNKEGDLKRKGSDKDMRALMKTFETLGFHPDNILVYRNASLVQMLKLLTDSVKKDDHANSDCFMCAILTHGYQEVGAGGVREDVVYGTDGRVPVRELIRIIDGCKDLVGKPKIFLIQACRGQKLSEPVEVEHMEQVAPFSKVEPAAESADTDDGIIADIVRRLKELVLTKKEEKVIEEMPEPVLPFEIPVSTDVLLANSTQPEFFSFRNEASGSPFINHFCREAHQHGETMDFQRLLTRVNRDVAYGFSSRAKQPEFSGKKLMPWIASRLTKDVIFRKKVAPLQEA